MLLRVNQRDFLLRNFPRKSHVRLCQMFTYYNSLYADAQVILALSGRMIVDGNFESTGCPFYLVNQYEGCHGLDEIKWAVCGCNRAVFSFYKLIVLYMHEGIQETIQKVPSINISLSTSRSLWTEHSCFFFSSACTVHIRPWSPTGSISRRLYPQPFSCNL